ncbi:MAG: HupE/UreJ family protein [Myxococcota bacterium]
MNRIFVALLCLGLAAPAAAHQKSVSYSKWTPFAEGALVQAKVSWFDLTSLPEAQGVREEDFDSSTFISYLQEHLRLRTDHGPCDVIDATSTVLPAERGWMRVEWRVTCDGEPTSLRSDLFAGLANHVHFATVLGDIGTDVVLSSATPSATLSSSTRGQPTGVLSYVRLGVEHILSGWDHLAFLLLLIVVASRLREVVLLVTGFTVGHSITLAAASLGAIVPNPRAVESIIAASILVVAVENVGAERTRSGRWVLIAMLGLFVLTASVGGVPAFWGLALFAACYFGFLWGSDRAGRLRWALACLFGFVHGLGFSGVLLEQDLPRAALVEALFGFNLGVELGQLAMVAIAWPVIQWLRRRGRGAPLVEWSSFAGAVIGTFALVVRAFGP